jgi:lysophospholipase L1-like esterase
MYKVTPAGKQILFVGDSIVEGINTLGTTSTSEANSAVAEFSFKTARKLNSIPMLQGYGGSTSFNGIKYERYSWVDASKNNFIVNNKIDAILIEYGYNDVSAGYTAEQFKQYYNELIDLLVGHYSGVPVFCLIPFKQSFAQAIREIASARSYCYCIETSEYEVTYSDNAHPNANGATSIAESLSEDIIKIMGKDYFV